MIDKVKNHPALRAPPAYAGSETRLGKGWELSNIEHRTPNIEHRTPNIEHRTSNTEHRTSNNGSNESNGSNENKPKNFGSLSQTGC